MLDQREITKYGGKGAILNHIRDNTDLPIPYYVVMNSENCINSIKSVFGSMKKPVIVRSSSPYEYSDFEGIFESVRDVSDIEDLESAIRTVKNSARSPRAILYASQHGFKLGDDMNIIIQEQTPSLSGGMLRHPNDPDLVFITYYERRGSYEQVYHSYLYDEKTKNEKVLNGFHSDSKEKDKVQFLIEKYKKIESLDAITKEEVLYVEFGLKPFAIYQARPFMKKQVADFKLPEYDGDNCLSTDFVFGLTPPEGITLPILKSIGYDLALDLTGCTESLLRNDKRYNQLDQILRHYLISIGLANQCVANLNEVSSTKERMIQWYEEETTHFKDNPYCLMIGNSQRDPYDLDLLVPNMKGLVVGETSNFLIHNQMRLFKSAGITLGIGPNLFYHDIYKNKNAENFFGKIRLYSNGKQGLAVLEDLPANEFEADWARVD